MYIRKCGNNYRKTIIYKARLLQSAIREIYNNIPREPVVNVIRQNGHAAE